MLNPADLSTKIKALAKTLGFDDCGISEAYLQSHIDHYRAWLKNKYHGDMIYMENNQQLREQPHQLHPGTLFVISVRLNYVNVPAKFTDTLASPEKANVSRYALGRDYHKLMRKRLKKLADEMEEIGVTHDSRAFVDSAPVLERGFAEQAGLGWIGKNSMLLNENSGSFFFLGELFTNLPLEPDSPKPNLCGACQSCINLCPTGAIVAPYQVDARRCISYLTIEHRGSIPIELRSKMGNRIYGCDDCQLVCPFNREAKPSAEPDFQVRNSLNDVPLLDLFKWSEKDFLKNFEGSPIRRIGYQSWIRNIAVALGNAPKSEDILKALEIRFKEPIDDMVKEHIQWAIHQQKMPATNNCEKQKKLLRTTQKIVSHLD